MEKVHKRYIAGGACAVVLCGAMLGTAADDSNAMTIDCQQVMYRSSASEEIDAPTSSVYMEGISVSFTAEPVGEKDGMTVFRCDSDITVLADLQGLTTSYPVTVNGTVKEIADSRLVLSDCVIVDDTSGAVVYETPSEEPVKAAVTTAVTVGNDTVYVSASGKYHKKPDCSGMKSYKAMKLTEATDHGYAACQRCY